MGERRRASDTALDWVIRARRYEYHLSAATPFHADVNFHPDPTPLELDIHEGIELGLLLEGEEERHYQGYLLRCRPGDVWMSAMWEPHGWRILQPNTRNLVFVFLPQFLGEELVGDIPWLSLLALPPEDRPTVSSPELRAHLLSIAAELRSELERRSRGWISSLRLNLLRLLLALSRDWRPFPPDPDLLQLHTHDLSRIMPALSLVHADLSHRISARQAASVCKVSRAHFNRLFTQSMGLSFARFSLRARLALSAHLLLSSNLSLQAIADQAGFVDASHLHRSFVQFYGCTPGRYRLRSNDPGPK